MAKIAGYILMISIFYATAGFAQLSDDALLGYWIEEDNSNAISLSTLLIFSKSDNGQLEGSVYFLDSDDHTREFPLTHIQFEDDSFSFMVSNTSISFYGKINEKHSGFSGSYMLDDNTSIPAIHQKVDDDHLRLIRDEFKKCQRKEIDHTDGVMTG